MRKLIPFLFCGFAALSYGALAADKDAEADTSHPKADEQARDETKDGAGAGATRR